MTKMIEGIVKNVVKIVVFICAGKDDLFKCIKNDFLRMLNDESVEISMVDFKGFLNRKKEFFFIKECVDADMIITDAWNHDFPMSESVKRAQESMRDIIQTIIEINRNAKIFVQLMEGQKTVSHELPYVSSHSSYSEPSVFKRPLLGIVRKKKMEKGEWRMSEDVKVVAIDDDVNVISNLESEMNIQGINIEDFIRLEFNHQKLREANIILLDHDMGILRGFDIIPDIRKVNNFAEIVSLSASYEIPKDIYRHLGVEIFIMKDLLHGCSKWEELAQVIDEYEPRKQLDISDENAGLVKKLIEKENGRLQEKISRLIREYDGEVTDKFKRLMCNKSYPYPSEIGECALPVFHDLFYRTIDLPSKILHDNIEDVVRIMCDAWRWVKDAQENLRSMNNKSGDSEEARKIARAIGTSPEYFLSHLHKTPQIIEARYEVQLGNFFEKDAKETIDILKNKFPVAYKGSY